jgi:vanillate O-demethylase ferredoxin subunit
METESIVSLELQSADGRELPAFAAGAHIDVQLPGGLVRPYSLCNDPGNRRRWRIAVLKERPGRGGSAAMHALAVGATLKVGIPRNNFVLHKASNTILIAGGIGVTPLLSMAHALSRDGAKFQLHYSTRSARSTAFREELEVEFGNLVHFHHDDGDDDQRLDFSRLLQACAPGTHAYICGPIGFIQHVTECATRAAVEPDRIHVESFGLAAGRQDHPNQPFRIRIASTGLEIMVPPEESVVQALRAQHVEVFTSCEQGVCGSCFTGVLEGECDHRDVYLTESEKASHSSFLPCVSRARSPVLVLDL